MPSWARSWPGSNPAANRTRKPSYSGTAASASATSRWLMPCWPRPRSWALARNSGTLEFSGSASGQLLDGVDAIGIEGQQRLDLGNRGIGLLIGPDRVGGFAARGVDAVIGGLALIGTMARMLATFEQFHMHVLAGDVVHRWVCRLLQGQRARG